MQGSSGGKAGGGGMPPANRSTINPYETLNRAHQAGRTRAAAVRAGAAMTDPGQRSTIDPHETLNRAAQANRARAAAVRTGAAVTHPGQEGRAAPATVIGNGWAERATALAEQVHGRLFGTYPRPAPGVMMAPGTPTAMPQGLSARIPAVPAAEKKDPVLAADAKTAVPNAAPPPKTLRIELAALWEKQAGQASGNAEPVRPRAEPQAVVEALYDRLVVEKVAPTRLSPERTHTISGSRNPQVERALSERQLGRSTEVAGGKRDIVPSEDIGFDGG